MKRKIKFIGLCVLMVVMGVCTRFVSGSAENADLDQYEQRTRAEMDDDETAALWQQLIESYGFKSLRKTGFTFALSSDAVKMTGYRNALYENEIDVQHIHPLAQGVLARQYKIHLMPTDETIDKVFEHLLVLVKNNEQLRSVIKSFKIINGYEDTLQEAEESRQLVIDNGDSYKGNINVTPRIVIYPGDDKSIAQTALDILYKEFKDVEGIDITPRFNTRVTSLIYVAQGGSEAKNPDNPGVAQSYELPYKVYYNPEVILPQDGKDHYLTHPQTGDPLIPTPDMFAE